MLLMPVRLRTALGGFVLATAALLGAVAPAASAAPGNITLDEPPDAAVPLTFAGGFEITGTYPGDDEGGQYGYCLLLDGLYVTDPPGQTAPGVSAVSYSLAVTEGTTMRLYFSASDLEDIGGTADGPHRVGVARVDWSGMDWVEVERVEMDVTLTPWVAPEPEEVAGAEEPIVPAADDAGDPATTPRPRAESRSELSTGRSDAPSVLSALPTAQNLGLTPERGVLTALLTVILLLVVGFPGQLMGSTISANYDRIFRRTAPIARRLRAVSLRASRPRPRWVPIAVGVAVASVLAGFVDPDFGFNAGSARVLASMALAFVIEGVLGWVVVMRVLRRTDPELRPTIRFRFGSLVVVALAVLVSRLVGFEPGLVFGLIVGLAFGASLAAAREARVTLVGLAYSFGLAIAGWLGYSVLVAAFGSEPGFLPTFAIETLSGIAVGGIAALPVALVPITMLDGGTIFGWNRWAWAGCYALGLFAFLVILMPLPFSWGTIGAPFATWIVLYAAYAIAAIGMWAYFRFLPAPRPTAPTGVPASSGSSLRDADHTLLGDARQEPPGPVVDPPEGEPAAADRVG